MLQLLVLERVEPEQNVHRYYVLSIEPTIFGEIGLRREWGRIGQRSGACQRDLYAGTEEAGEALGTWLRRKQGRGYAVRAYPNVEETARGRSRF